MITLQQRIVLKKILRGNYALEVQDVLEKKGVLNKNNNPHSTKMISHVLNGRYGNRDIENAIFEVYEKRKSLLLQEEERKNKILGIDNSSKKGNSSKK